MKILIELSHPAHVHYFRNFINEMEKKSHEFIIIARDKEVAFSLLNAYKIKFISFGKTKKTFLGKIVGLILDDLKLLVVALRVKPDMYLSFSSPFVGHIAWLMRKPHIVFDDTEHASLEHFMYKPFASSIVTPFVFSKNMGKKHIKFDSFFEMCYLHPNFFKPDPSILKILGINQGERYMLLRFISWDAIHDSGHRGIPIDIKRRAVKELSKYARIFISSEAKLPQDLIKYQIKISPEQIHHVMAYSDLFFGESGTMAVESALLGTPSVRVSTLAASLGNFKELKNNYNLIHFYSSAEEGLEKALELIKDNRSKNLWAEKRNKLVEDKIDVTSYMVWLVENYPQSIKGIYKPSKIFKKTTRTC
jgi:uncharacterized protein